MRETTLDLVLLPLVILFLGLHQRSRPRRYFHFWLAGWIFVLFSIAVWTFGSDTSPWSPLQQCIRYNALVCGGIAFALSFVPTSESWQRSALSGLFLSLAPSLLIDLTIVLPNPHPWLLYLLILLGQTVASLIAFRYLRKENNWRTRPWNYRIILSLCLIGAAWMSVLVHTGRSDLLYVYTFAQIFLSAAILFLTRWPSPTTATWIGAVGFSAWAIGYPLFASSDNFPTLLHVYGQLWNLPKYLVGFSMVLKVMEEDQAEIAALSQEYRILYEGNPHPMWICDPRTAAFLSANDAAVKAYGYSIDDFLRMTLFDLLPSGDAHLSIPELLGLQADTERICRHRRSNGTVFDVSVTAHNTTFLGKPARFELAMDITEQQKLNRELVHRAQHDSLTELPNRILLEDRLQQCLQRAARERQRFALLTIDVDAFKHINDTYGHPVGDQCLKLIAARMSSRIRQADTLARTGGEEFTALTNGPITPEGALKVAQGLLSLFDDPLILPGHTIKTSISIGIALYPDDGEDSDTIRIHSDKALYRAKRLGGNRIAFASHELHPTSTT